MSIELLYVPDCPNQREAHALVQRIAAEEHLATDLRLIEVTSPEQAEALRFLGSPSIRVDGRDIEPDANERDTFTLACRLYRTDSGLGGLPAEAWLRAALRNP